MVLSIDRWVGKLAIVTGAAGGMGTAISTKLVESGIQVAGLDKNNDRLEYIAKKLSDKKGKFVPLKVDLTKEEDILSVFKWVKENLGPIHILVNNAGLLGQSNAYNGDAQLWNDVFLVNVIGLSIATREAIKDMRANNVDGHIIHINSTLGHQIVHFPGLYVYPASKYAVTALAETLRLELNSLKSKIKITSVSPGTADTDFIPPEFKVPEVRQKLREENKLLEPEHVADAIIYALSTPPHVQIQELTVRSLDDI